MPEVSKVHSNISGRNVRAFEKFPAEQFQALAQLGINITPRDVAKMQTAFDAEDTGMDALQALQTTASIADPVQFLQTWLPGFVYVITQARKIDEIVGVATVGNWEDEQIVQGYLEQTGKAQPYSDLGNIPLSSWNTNWETRTIVRFEQGMSVGKLEGMRAAKIKLDSAGEKRTAATLTLEILRNSVGFNGYNNGNNNTFGFLNEPNLPAYVEVANGATSGTPGWATKTFLDITADLRTAFAAVRIASGDNIDPAKTQMTLVVATNIYDFMSVTTPYGDVSVIDWLNRTYPNTRIISAPELNLAHASDNVFYLFAESVVDGSSDDKNTWMQMVPNKFMMLGIENRAKSYVEDFSNALAGLLLKRAYTVVRYYGC
jgi:hypothetical protein